jgi:hypothetical protein
MQPNLARSPDYNDGIGLRNSQEIVEPSLLVSVEQVAVLDGISVAQTKELLNKSIPDYILTDRTSLVTMRANLSRIKGNIASRERPKPQYAVMASEEKNLLLNLIDIKLEKIDETLAKMDGGQVSVIAKQPAANDEPYEGDLDSAFNEGVTVSELPPEDAARFFPDTIPGAQTENTAVDIDLSKPTPKPTTPVDLEI